MGGSSVYQDTDGSVLWRDQRGGIRTASPSSTLARTDHEDCESRLAAALDKIANLQTALLTGRKIGTAVGIIMATYRITDDAAFDMLAVASQRTSKKLRDVAQDVIDTGQLNWGPGQSE